mmetsp:Transcript_60378/g.72577  ORF Transcript_60378/g.72577 Transcript_60378/m.72577 type:complete len:163 (+) Transcript_60378:2-490(+)
MPHFGNGKLGEEGKQAIKDARKRFGKDTDELEAFKARIKAERKADRKGLTDRGVITPEGSTIPHIAGIFPKKMSKKDTEVIEHNFQRSIKEVNKQLEKFAAKHDNVFYSKTEYIFYKSFKNETINNDLVGIDNYPTAKGYRKWLGQSFDTIQKVLDKEEVEA